MRTTVFASLAVAVATSTLLASAAPVPADSVVFGRFDNANWLHTFARRRNSRTPNSPDANGSSITHSVSGGTLTNAPGSSKSCLVYLVL